MDEYKKEWVALLLKQNYRDWLIGVEKQYIFIRIPDASDLEETFTEFQKELMSLKSKVKSKQSKLGFFMGNSINSKFFELLPG